MTDLTEKEMIATILRSLEKTGRRFATHSKQKTRAPRRTRTARSHSKSKSSRAADAKQNEAG
jgi:hypothetical protein